MTRDQTSEAKREHREQNKVQKYKQMDPYVCTTAIATRIKVQPNEWNIKETPNENQVYL